MLSLTGAAEGATVDVPILGDGGTPSNPISTHLNKGEDAGPQIRLLICKQCSTVDELPDYQGDPRHDHLLQIQIDRHHTDRLTGQTHVGNMVRVPLKYWARHDTKTEILRQIREGSGGLNEVDEKFYTTRSTFFEDAMACYNTHLRPKGMCSDYKSDKKRLLPDTDKERKDLGLAKAKEAGPKTYLCQFCPVHTYAVTRARAEKGMYK